MFWSGDELSTRLTRSFDGRSNHIPSVARDAQKALCSGRPAQTKFVPTFKTREDLGAILEQEGLKTGAELGVQTGWFSEKTLSRWPSCTSFLLVDLWAHQEHYIDLANGDQAAQDGNYRFALEVTKPWKEKIHVCRNYTTACVKTVPDESLDFIYVDARHDYKGVEDDLNDWWPKLRQGGIMAGHDYVTQDDGPQRSGQDWTHNYDGTVDETGTVVKGAVDKFAREVACRQVTVSYREGGWNTWAFRK